METLLSLDLGTTAIKAALYSLDGQAIGSSTAEYPLISPSPECVEQDAGLWWSLAVRTIQEAVRKAGAAGRSVCALSLSSQGISFVPVSLSGALLRNALCWLDTRAGAEAADLQAQFGAEWLFSVTGKRPSPAYVLPKLLWLRNHEPELYVKTGKFLMAHDYLLYRLCGAKLTDYSLAGGSLLLDIHSLTWSEALLACFDIHPEQLPGLAWAGTVAGTLSGEVAQLLGLSPGILVVVGGQDQKCATLGAAIRPGVATVSLGTASAISCLVERPLLDPQRRIPVFPFVLPGYWVLEGVVGTAGAALRWARDTFFPQEGFPALDEWAGLAQPGANGVRFYPHLAGATSPTWDSGARGAFGGLSLATGKGDIVRAILEGVAFQIRANLDAIEALAPVEELVLFGGGANSKLWVRIIAEVTGKPARVTRTVDVANWGACLLAGKGAGLVQEPLNSAAHSLSTEAYLPQPTAVQRYQEPYEEYTLREPG